MQQKPVATKQRELTFCVFGICTSTFGNWGGVFGYWVFGKAYLVFEVRYLVFGGDSGDKYEVWQQLCLLFFQFD